MVTEEEGATGVETTSEAAEAAAAAAALLSGGGVPTTTSGPSSMTTMNSLDSQTSVALIPSWLGMIAVMTYLPDEGVEGGNAKLVTLIFKLCVR